MDICPLVSATNARNRVPYTYYNFGSEPSSVLRIKTSGSTLPDYERGRQVADAALDAGFMDGNNFLSVAPKSEYITYNQKLGSAVSTWAGFSAVARKQVGARLSKS